jgi:hypothetical protein
MFYIRRVCLSLVILVFVVSAFGQKSERMVKNNTIISNKLPKIEIVVKGKFEYVGKFDFKIRDVATFKRAG